MFSKALALGQFVKAVPLFAGGAAADEAAVAGVD